jgi:hypothetical protein
MESNSSKQPHQDPKAFEEVVEILRGINDTLSTLAELLSKERNPANAPSRLFKWYENINASDETASKNDIEARSMVILIVL